MKKLLILSAAMLFIGASAVFAQGGKGQGRSLEDRVKAAMEKLADMKLDSSKSASTAAVLESFYMAQQKQREDMRAAGGEPDRDAMRAQMLKLATERDGKLKAIFTAEQYKNWVDEIEPSLRPQRQNRQQ